MAIFEKKDLPLKWAGQNELARLLLPAAVIFLLIAAVAGALVSRRALRQWAREAEKAAPAVSVVSNSVPLPVPVSERERVLLAESRKLLAENALEQAEMKAREALETAVSAGAGREAEDLLGAINIAMIASPSPMKGKSDYTIVKGDTLERIAKRHGTTVELLAKSNNIKGHIIRPGDRLRVFTERFEIEVSKSDNELKLTAGGRFFKRYRIGTGKHDSTPEGEFAISDKISEPPWWRPDGRLIPYGDKENILGTRWMAIAARGDTPEARGYGIHGTWSPETIGTSSSAGCIRMHNADVEELFMLVPLGTRVVIKKQ